MRKIAGACALLTAIYVLVRPPRRQSAAQLIGDMSQVYADSIRIALGGSQHSGPSLVKPPEPRTYEDHYFSFPEDEPYNGL